MNTLTPDERVEVLPERTLQENQRRRELAGRKNVIDVSLRSGGTTPDPTSGVPTCSRKPYPLTTGVLRIEKDEVLTQ